MKISAIITAYKRPEGLGKTLSSLKKQKRSLDEVIVLDDSGPDYPRMNQRSDWDYAPSPQYVKNDETLGMPRNLNKAIAMASGDLIINLHDGDEYDPNLVLRCEDVFESNQHCAMVFWASTNNYSYPRGIAEVTPGRLFFEQHFLFGTASKIWGTAAVRKSTYKKVGLFDERFGAWADVDMWMRICKVGQIGYIPDPMVELMKESSFRGFNWEISLQHHTMVIENIKRMYEDDSSKIAHAVRKQEEVRAHRWFRHMAGRIRKVDLKGIVQGIRIAPQYFRKSTT